MDNGSKQELSRSRYKFVTRELERLKSAGILSPEKTDEIADLYKCREFSGSYVQRAFLALLLLGVTALGFAAYSGVVEFWDSLSSNLRLTIALAPFIVSYVVYAVSRIKGWEQSVKASLFAGSVFFLLCVAYLINEYAPHKLEICTLWFAGALAAFVTAFFSKAKSLHALAVLLIVCWIVATIDEAHTKTNAHQCVAVLYDHACCLTLAFVGLGMFWSRRRSEPFVGTLYMLLLAFWQVALIFNYEIYNLTALNVVFIGASMLLVETFCRRCGIVRCNLRFLGYAAILCALPFATNENFFKAPTRDFSFFQEATTNVPTFATLGLALLAFIANTVLDLRKKNPSRDERPTLTRLVSVLTSPEALCVTALPIYIAAYSYVLNDDARFVCSVWGNVLMCAIALHFVLRGVNGRSLELIVGVLYFILWLVLRTMALVKFIHMKGDSTALLLFTAIAIGLFALAFGIRYFLQKEPGDASVDEEYVFAEPKEIASGRLLFAGVAASIAGQFILVAYLLLT